MTTRAYTPAAAESADTRTTTFPLRAFAAVMLVALAGRVLLLLSNSVSFHSDEAVVALMARHILQGERPVFFYGQAYMGSLDAWLVALGFRLFGESVQAIRIVQSALYLLVVATGFAAAWRLSGRALVAAVAGLTLAVPPVLVVTYTAATLGGYNETLIFGNLLLLLGYEVTHKGGRAWWRWALLGFIGGLAWWTNGLIVAYAAPVAVWIAYRLVRPVDSGLSVTKQVARLGVALLAFFVGSAPWWVFNLQHDWAALAFYLGSTGDTQFAGNEVGALPLGERVIGMLFLGLPTLVGLRFPWSAAYFAAPLGVIVLLIFVAAVWTLARRGERVLLPGSRVLLLLMLGIYGLIFFVSKFSSDPTGRYFLPVALPFGIALGVLVATLKPSRWVRLWRAAIVAFVLAYFALGQVVVATTPPGFTTQFNLETHLPHDDDAALIAFLDEHDLHAGYTTYWVSFRLAFLSGERMQYSAALPYKSALQYTPADERYPAYRAAADAAVRPAYIVANVPAVREWLEARFAERGVTYQHETIGIYDVYYDFAPDAPRPPLE